MSFEVLLVAISLVLLSASISSVLFAFYWQIRRQRKLEKIVLERFVIDNRLAVSWDSYVDRLEREQTCAFADYVNGGKQ